MTAGTRSAQACRSSARTASRCSVAIVGGTNFIRDDAEKLGEEVGKGAKGLDVLLRKAKTTLKALNVELTEAEDSKAAPLLLPATSLSEARAALATPSANDAEPRKLG